jgi:hypothetical protein
VGEVVDMQDKKGRWASGEIQCSACKAEWVGVHPIPLRCPLECPECGRMLGYPKWPYSEGDKARFECELCRGSVWQLIENGTILCVSCGNQCDNPG